MWGVLPPLSSRSLHATLRRILSDDEQETMDNARGLLERRVIASLAGTEAEALYTGIHPLTQLPPDTDDASAWDMWQAVWEMYTQAAAPKMSTLSSPDLRHACALIAPGTKSDDEAIAYLRYLQLRARNLVRRHRDEVEALAVPLTVCGEFTYRQAYHLVYKLAACWEALRTLRALMALGMVVPGEQAA